MKTRRDFITGAVAGLGALTFLQPLRAIAEMTIGDIRLTTVSDGNLILPSEFVFGRMPKNTAKTIQEQFALGDDTITPPCNVTLLRNGQDVVLFDAGSGSQFQDSAGHLVDMLDAIDIAPEDVTHVVFTHAHPDHLWGVLDDFDDPLFYNAQHMIGASEHAYWSDPATVNSIAEDRASFAVGAARRLEALGDDLERFEDGQEIIPGVLSQMTPGHTPGHMSFVVASGAASALILGDAISNHHAAFAYPDVASGADEDPELAAKTRRALFDQVTADNMRIIGFHLPDGGIGSVAREGDTYRFVPENHT